MRHLQHQSERGAALILVAASLLVLMGLTAVVVDGGMGFSERRQAQSAADFGALAAAQFSLPATISTECPAGFASLELATCRGAVEAKAVVDGNLPAYSLTWADWQACVDPDPSRAAKYSVPASVMIGSVKSTIDCIRFTPTTQEVRVVVPTVAVGTTFGRVLGVEELNVSAFAEVEGELPEETDLLPFGVPANASDHYDCLKSGANPNWGACNGPAASGNFGYLNIPTYGNPKMGTTSDGCSPTNDSLLSNMIRGIDHGLGPHPTGVAAPGQPARRDDKGTNTTSRLFVCPIFGSNANEVSNQTGNVSGVFDQGMTYGFGSTERGALWADTGLLVRNAGGAGVPATRIDDTPLWDFMLDTSFCPAPPDDTQSMVECLAAWTPSIGVVFNSDIKYAKRYGFAPRLHSNFSSASWYFIAGLQPIYLQTSYWSCTPATGNGCSMIHAPDEGDTGSCPTIATPTTGSEAPDTTCGVPQNANKSLDAVTAFILDERMLPSDAILPYKSDGPLINLNLTE